MKLVCYRIDCPVHLTGCLMAMLSEFFADKCGCMLMGEYVHPSRGPSEVYRVLVHDVRAHLCNAFACRMRDTSIRVMVESVSSQVDPRDTDSSE